MTKQKQAISKLATLILTSVVYIALSVVINSLGNSQIREILLLVNCSQFIAGMYFFWISPDNRLRMIWVPIIVVVVLSWVILSMHETRLIGSIMKDYSGMVLLLNFFVLALQVFLTEEKTKTAN